MVKAAEKRKDNMVMISEANALKRKSDEQSRGNQCFGECSFTNSGTALKTLKKLIDFVW